MNYFIAVLLAISLIACGKIDIPSIDIPVPVVPGPDSINDPEAPNPPVGTVDEVTGFYVRTISSPNYTYYTHKGSTTPDEPCIAAEGELVDCYVEAQELDLYFNGVQLQYNVPSSLCDYLRFSPYFYYKWEIGNGPAFVQIDTDAQGQVGVDPGNTGTVTGPVVSCQSAPTFYDYTPIHGPNCCVGTYTKVTRTWDGDTNSYVVTGTTTNVEWGGEPGSCLGGPAVDTQTHDSLFGFPLPTLYYVAGTGINLSYSIASPISKSLGSAVYAANFFDPAGNGGNPPVPMYPAAVSPWNEYPRPEPYYRFQCLDRGHENVAEIRLFIRKWNTNPEFDNILTDPTLYNVLGSEPAPWAAYPNNDYASWLDFVNTFPRFSE